MPPFSDTPPPSDLPRPMVAVMSSGFFGFFAHAGFLEALLDLGLEPEAYAGSSSGALVAALAAAGQTPEQMLAGFSALRLKDFWDPPRPWQLPGHLLKGFRGRSGYLAGEAFEQTLNRALPVQTFEQCPRPCLVVALDVDSGQRVVLKQGPLAPAVRASGAVPSLFSAVELDGRLLVDGGLVDKAPLAAAVEHLGARTLLVHVLPSGSLGGPAAALLQKPFSPLRLQYRAVAAARWQHYLDQLATVRARGVVVREVRAQNLPRPGPRRLHLGPQAFAQAREGARGALAGAPDRGTR